MTMGRAGDARWRDFQSSDKGKKHPKKFKLIHYLPLEVVMLRVVFFLTLSVFGLSCAQEKPTAPSSAQKAATLGEFVSINGETYRRQAAKQGETQTDYRITITIPVSTQPDGSLVLSNTIEVGGRTYTADCSDAESSSTTSDDVGNTRDTATNLSVRYASSAANDPGYWRSSVYQLGRSDVDYFRLRVTRTVDLGVISYSDIDLKGKLINSQGRILSSNDDGPANEPGDYNFFVVSRVSPGTYYVEVMGVRGSTTGPYSLGVGTWHPSSGKPVAQGEDRQIQIERLARF